MNSTNPDTNVHTNIIAVITHLALNPAVLFSIERVNMFNSGLSITVTVVRLYNDYAWDMMHIYDRHDHEERAP